MAATEPDFAPIYARLAPLPAFPAGEVQASDRVIHRGTGEGWVRSGDV
jgi:phenylalanine-4-hydroxylase